MVGENERDVDEELRAAAQKADLKLVRHLLETGADPNKFDEISQTALHHAVISGSKECVRMLLDAGANIDAHEEQMAGNTPLIEAARSGSLEMTRMLVKAGADPFICGWMGLDAVYRASRRKSDEGRDIYNFLRSLSDPVTRMKIQKKSKRK